MNIWCSPFLYLECLLFIAQVWGQDLAYARPMLDLHTPNGEDQLDSLTSLKGSFFCVCVSQFDMFPLMSTTTSFWDIPEMFHKVTN